MFKESVFQNIKEDNNKNEILSQFSLEEQKEIEQKRKILSSLAFFVGKDFEIPVELNFPGQGWHWDFKNNIIRIDPIDLLEKDMDYLRFVISHEGGHRRISRTDFIPLETWKQSGFSFLMNSIEDPRDNNFVADSYHKFRDQMEFAYAEDIDIEEKHKEKAKQKLGYTPRFMSAGFEYIKQWFKEATGKEAELSEDLPIEVKEVVEKTLSAAKNSWLTYPSKKMADGQEFEKIDGKNITGEELIKEYARASYEINLDKIWPEFKKLVEKDREDQNMQEFMKDMQSEKGESGDKSGMPQELKDQLSPEEQKELEEAIDQAIEENKKNTNDKQEKADGGQNSKEGESPTEDTGEINNDKQNKGSVINIDSLSDELKQKIKDYIDSLPEDKKQELEEKAEKSIKDFENEINDDLSGKLTEKPEDRKEEGELGGKDKDQEEKDQSEDRQSQEDPEEINKYRQEIEKSLKKDANIYEENRREVLGIIDSLENDLREIFVQRATRKWKSGFKIGKRIDIKRRIQEKAKGVSAMESKAWQKREMPSAKDYAITLLVDLSGSMRGEKINETFKAVIVLSEVLNRLSINTEILGFNDRLYEYQEFGQDISKDIRENMGGMLKEVDNFNGGRAKYNDDGWAISQASTRLGKQKAKEKFLLVLSDGLPEESPQHSGDEYNLEKQIDEILKNTDQKLIGLGIGEGTKHVENFYPNSLANIEVKKMGKNLAQVIKEVIENFDKF